MYQKSTLENGICVVTEATSAQRSIAMGILIDAGPRNEAPNQFGLAHLVEHVMFSGTSSRSASQIARMIDEAGGNMGAFTARDYTCYYATVLDDYFPYALDLMGDILLNSIFPTQNLEKEKDAILREIESICDIPAARAHDLLKAIAWPDHPLGRPIVGTPKTVKPMAREDVIYFVHEHYLPDRMIVAAAGNLDHEDFVAQVRDAYWRLIGQSQPIARKTPRYRSEMRLAHMPVSQAYFSLGIRVCPYTDPDRYGLHILNNILGGGISSRLFRRLREKHGIVYHINSEYHAYRDDGMLVIEGSTAPEKILQVLDMVFDEFWKLISAEDPLNEEEIWKAKMHIRGQHLISGESTNTRMSRLAVQELYFGRQLSDDEILTEIEKVNSLNLQSLTDNVLPDAMRQAAIAIVGPEADDRFRSLAIERLSDRYNWRPTEGR